MQACKPSIGIFALVLALTKPSSAQDGWSGIWKLNRGKSRLVGPSITIRRIPTGYHFDFGAVSFNVGDDGKEYTTIPTRTTIIKVIGERTWYRAHKVNGIEVDHGTLTVTRDEQHLLIHTVATNTDGRKSISDEIEVREGTGTGLAGTWRSSTRGVNVSPIFRLTYTESNKIRREFLAEGQSYEAVVNGTPVAYTGPRAAPNVMISLHAISPTELEWTESVDKKPYDMGNDILSQDGKTLYEASWPVARPQDRQNAVYDKQ